MAGIFANNRFKGASTTAARNVLGGSYNSMETNADKMKSATDKFLDNTDKGLFAKLKESGKTEDVIKQAKELASAYNDTLENLGTETSVLANFYQKQLRSLAQGNVKELAEIQEGRTFVLPLLLFAMRKLRASASMYLTTAN